MTKHVVQLYPQPGGPVPLRGLYLRRNRLVQKKADMPLVYANFLTSMDGRIALKTTQESDFQLPDQLKSEEDFMLLLELYAHADCIITHGGYMRALAEQRLGNVLQLPTTRQAAYLHEWRQQQGLKPNPDVIIVSGSLDFPWHDSLDESGQNVHIVTGGSAAKHHQQQWLDRNHNVQQFGEGRYVDVNMLMSYLQSHNYRSVCLMAGPDLLQDMLMHGYVHSFFMTMTHQFLSGQAVKTLLNGEILSDTGRLTLEALYMDEQNSNTVSQWFIEFSIT